MKDNWLSMQNEEFWKGMTLEVVPDGTEVRDSEDDEVHAVTDDNSVISGKQVFMTQPTYDRVMSQIAILFKPMADRFVSDLARVSKRRRK